MPPPDRRSTPRTPRLGCIRNESSSVLPQSHKAVLSPIRGLDASAHSKTAIMQGRHDHCCRSSTAQQIVVLLCTCRPSKVRNIQMHRHRHWKHSTVCCRRVAATGCSANPATTHQRHAEGRSLRGSFFADHSTTCCCCNGSQYVQQCLGSVTQMMWPGAQLGPQTAAAQ